MKDSRFAVIAFGNGPVASQLAALNVDYYIDYNPDPRTAPSGKIKVPFIRVSTSRISQQDLVAFAQAKPGSYWYIGGEPNVSSQDWILPSDYVDQFDYYATTIKNADPTAKIVGPSILNWSWRCDGCLPSPTPDCASGNFRCGSWWMDEFFKAYAEDVSHPGALPPIDVYAIDAYPLTWNSVPMTNWQRLTEQISEYRAFLNAKGLSTKPVWITEIASHWAYDGWRIENGRVDLALGLDWEDDYRWDAMTSYMTNLFNWLRANSQSMYIEKWFLFVAYTNIQQQVKSDGYAGIYLFASGEPGAPLNQLGELYRDMALGLR